MFFLFQCFLNRPIDPHVSGQITKVLKTLIDYYGYSILKLQNNTNTSMKQYLMNIMLFNIQHM